MIKDLHTAESLLNEYADGALSSSKTVELEAHLAGCLECQSRLAEIHFVFQALEELPEAPLEADLAEGVLTAIKSLPNQQKERSRWSRLMAPDRFQRPVSILGQRVPIGSRTLGWFSLIQVLSAMALLLATWPVILRMIPMQLFSTLGERVGIAQTELINAGWERLNMVWSSFQATLLSGWESWNGMLSQLGRIQVSLLGFVVLLVVATSLWIMANGLLLTTHNSNGYASILKRRT